MSDNRDSREGIIAFSEALNKLLNYFVAEWDMYYCEMLGVIEEEKAKLVGRMMDQYAADDDNEGDEWKDKQNAD